MTKGTNVVTFNSAPGFNKYTAYCQEVNVNPDTEDTNIITSNMVSLKDEDEPVQEEIRPCDNLYSMELNHDIFNGRTMINESKFIEPTINNDEAQLLQYHRNFGHIPFPKLQVMAKHGIIPARLAKCNIPTCAACMGE